MWKITWIYFGAPSGPQLRTVATPSEFAARTVFGALRQVGWAARLWNRDGRLA